MREILRLVPEPDYGKIVSDPFVRRMVRREAIDILIGLYEKLGLPEEDRKAAKERLIKGTKIQREDGSFVCNEDGTFARKSWENWQIVETIRTANEVLKGRDEHDAALDSKEIIIVDGVKAEDPSPSAAV